MLNQKDMKEEWLTRRSRTVWFAGTVVRKRLPPVHGGGARSAAGHDNDDELYVFESMVQLYVCCPLIRKLSGTGSTPASLGDHTDPGWRYELTS